MRSLIAFSWSLIATWFCAKTVCAKTAATAATATEAASRYRLFIPSTIPPFAAGDIMTGSMFFGPILKRSFYARDSVAVARDLLGKVLVHGETAGIIVETEAY